MAPMTTDPMQAQLDSLDDSAPLVPQPDRTLAPANSPLPTELREALLWCSHNNVIEADFVNKRFTVKPSAPPAVPTVGDVKEKFGKRPPLAPGGYDKDLLFASSPKPYSPEEDEPQSTDPLT